MKKSLSLFLFLMLLLAPMGTFAQRSNAERDYSPVQLGLNAITLPASNVTADSAIIPLVDVQSLSVIGSCTQGAKLTVRLYAEDNMTSLATIDVDTAIAASSQSILNLSAQQAPAVSGSGTVASGLRLPLTVASFFFTNSGASAGTCTARLRLMFN